MNILLHICCGICAIPALDQLLQEGHQVTGFFYNPNIYPEEEYYKRLDTTQKVCREFNISLEIASYEPSLWIEKTVNFTNEPEGGARCPICFQLRLEKTYQHMIATGKNAFTTTLTSSRYKPSEVINNIGQEIAGNRFLVRDFKKDASIERTRSLIRQWNLYSQKYCGCQYSIRNQPKKTDSSTISNML